MEKFFIYKETKKGNQLNDKHTISHNKIFEIILNKNVNWVAFKPASLSVINGLYRNRNLYLALHIYQTSISKCLQNTDLPQSQTQNKTTSIA